MAFPTSRRGLAKEKLNAYAILRFRTIHLKSHPIAKGKLKTSCISVKQIIDNDDDEANPPPPFHDEKEEEEEEKEEDNQGADEEITIREDNNDDDDDEEELMRVFTWRVDGHEYKLPMKKILVCSSSQQSRLVVITVDVFNLSIVKKKKLNKFRLG